MLSHFDIFKFHTKDVKARQNYLKFGMNEPNEMKSVLPPWDPND